MNSKRKLKQKKRRIEKRSKRSQEVAVSPAEALLARIDLERRVRYENRSESSRKEKERLLQFEAMLRAKKVIK